MSNRFLISVILLVFNAMLLPSLRAQNADAAATAAKVPSAPNADKLYVLVFNDVSSGLASHGSGSPTTLR